MFSVIGLALDLVGAITIARGLFRHAERLFPGYGRWPTLAAEDYAYGVTGGLLLALGFFCQALPSLGATWDATAGEARVAALVALAVAILIALIGYGISYAIFLRRELRLVNTEKSTNHQARWTPTPRRPWHQTVDWT
jgi:hypothetical protein